MQHLLSNFSKRSVTPKYPIVEMPRSVRSNFTLFFLFEGTWFISWMSLSIRTDNWWFALPLFIPVFFRERILKLFHRWHRVGLITFTGDQVSIEVNGAIKTINFPDQAKIRLWTVVTAQTGSSRHLPQFATIVGIQFEPTEHLLVSNEMYLTAEDKLQFMEPPPSFGSWIFQACRQYNIKVTTQEDQPWADWLEAR